MEKVKLNTIEEAIEDFKAGNFVIVVDDEDRENEGDLIIAAEKITPEKVNFMLKHARGVLIRLLLRQPSDVRDTSTPCMLRKKVYYVVPGIQKLRLIWPVWQVFILRVHLWKS